MTYWQPIETAPKDRRIRLWADDTEYHGHWSADQYNRKPRPFWKLETTLGIAYSRAHQPTHWMPTAAPPDVNGEQEPSR